MEGKKLLLRLGPFHSNWPEPLLFGRPVQTSGKHTQLQVVGQQHLLRDLVKTTLQARDPLWGGGVVIKRPGVSSQGPGGYVRDQGSQANGGDGHVRDQGSQGKEGGRVCEKPGVSGKWWGCV